MSDPSDSRAAGSPAAQIAPLVPIGWDARRATDFKSLAPPGALPARVARVDRASVLALSASGIHRAEARPCPA